MHANIDCSKHSLLDRVSVDDPFAVRRLAKALQEGTGEVRGARAPCVVLCIGSDRSTGDALGPLVGSRLRGRCLEERVFGTLERPVHAANLQETLVVLRGRWDHPFLLAVDASLGQPNQVGTISIGRGPLKPGAGVSKELPLVGQMFVTGTVNIGGFMEYAVLQNTRLSLVMKMAEIISAALLLASPALDGLTRRQRA